MQIVVIDGKGGGIGKALVQQIKEALPEAKVVAVGTNTLATVAMLKAGADIGATGENAIKYNCTQADIIVGPMGIILPNALHGEISPEIARGVMESPAEKILIPVEQCAPVIVGLSPKPLQEYLVLAVEEIKKWKNRKAQDRQARS